MAAETIHTLTPQEYLTIEREQPTKSEFLNGEMFALAGATEAHNLIITNLVRELSSQLKGRPCKVYPNDMRVNIPRTGLYTYPDVIVVCGQPEFEDEHRDTLLNPIVLIEVLSPSTEAYDRGAKFGHYRSIATLREYVLVSQTTALLEYYERQDNGLFWTFSEARGLDVTLELPAIDCRLLLAEMYDKVEMNSPGQP
jgi:Uma2 family endonuclease